MSIPDPFDTPESAAETLPNVQACYALCACVKCLTDQAEPNPYRVSIEVSENWVDLVTHDHGKERNVDAWRFDTKEEADTHAALILSALRQAVME